MKNSIEFVELIRKLSRIIDRILNKKLPSEEITKFRNKDVNNTYQNTVSIRITQIALLEALDDLSWYTSQEGHISEEGVPQVALAKHLGVDTATMCRNVNLLIRGMIKPWVNIKKHNDKIKLISISPEGKRVLERAKRYVVKINEDTREKIKNDERLNQIKLKDLCEQLSLLLEILTPLVKEDKKKKSKSENKK